MFDLARGIDYIGDVSQYFSLNAITLCDQSRYHRCKVCGNDSASVTIGRPLGWSRADGRT